MGWKRLGPGIRPKMRDAIVEIRNLLYPQKGDVYYVSKRGTSGDGKSWEASFLTITEGIAALTDGDTLIIGAGNYDEAAPVITLDDVKDVRIFGMSNGMQWGEGSTNWRSVTSEADLFNIQNCKGVEIAGIGFITPTNGKDGIQFVTENSYSIHIHDCCFVGDCGSGVKMAEGIGSSVNTLVCDLWVHHCRFFRCKTALINIGQRAVIEKNVIIIPANGIGISGIAYGSGTGYNVIRDNDFLGKSDGDTGIYMAGMNQNDAIVVRNRFAGIATPVTTGLSNVDESFVDNYNDDATGGYTLTDPGDV